MRLFSVGLYDPKKVLLTSEANLYARSAACRAQVVSALLGSIQGTAVSYGQEYDLAIFILNEHPSLSEIRSRLGSLQDSEQRQVEGLLEAQEAIAQATVATAHYIHSVTGEEARQPVSEVHTGLEPEFGRLHIKRLDEALHSRKVGGGTNTEFEDINTYSQSVDETYIDAINSDDDVSFFGTL